MRGIYRITLLSSSLVALWLSIAVTGSNALAASSPDLALALWPGNAVAHAKLADSAVVDTKGVPTDDSDALAALRRDPSLASAARNLATVESGRGNEKRAAVLFDYGQQVSRRDIITQLWLIEQQVARGDVVGALVHYDRAMRVSEEIRPTLFDVLSKALADHTLTSAVARTAAASDLWRPTFLDYAGQHAAPLDLASLHLALNELGKPGNADQINALTNTLATNLRFAEAARVYRILNNNWRADRPDLQLDGAISRAGGSVFDWQLSNGAEQSTDPQLPLDLRFGNLDGTPIAAKTILLPIGAYVLTGLVDGLSADASVAISIGCFTVGGPRPLGSSAIKSDGMLRVDFAVPAGCPAQIIQIQGNTSEGADGTASLGRLQLKRVR